MTFWKKVSCVSPRRVSAKAAVILTLNVPCIMKKILVSLAVVAGVLTIAACDKVQDPAGAAAMVSFRVSIDNPGTKVSYTDQSATNPDLPIKLAWEAGDQLSVLILNDSDLAYADDGFEGRAIYNFTTEQGGSSAEFTGNAPRALEDGEYYMVVYPAICKHTGYVLHAESSQFWYESDHFHQYLIFKTGIAERSAYPKLSQIDYGVLMTAFIDGEFGAIDDVTLQHQTGILKMVIQKPSFLTGDYILSDIYTLGCPIPSIAPFSFGQRVFVWDPGLVEFGTFLNPASFPDDGFILYVPTARISLTGGDSFDLVINKSPLLDPNNPTQSLDQKKLVLNVTIPDGVSINVMPGTMFTLTIGANAPWTEVDYE